MRKTNKELFEQNRQAILNALPATFSQLKSKLNVHDNTISKHLKVLLEEDIIHIQCKTRIHKNGPMSDLYTLGPKPLDGSFIHPRKADRIPKPDFLTATFFGLTSKQNAKTF